MSTLLAGISQVNYQCSATAPIRQAKSGRNRTRSDEESLGRIPDLCGRGVHSSDRPNPYLDSGVSFRGAWSNESGRVTYPPDWDSRRVVDSFAMIRVFRLRNACYAERGIRPIRSSIKAPCSPCVRRKDGRRDGNRYRSCAPSTFLPAGLIFFFAVSPLKNTCCRQYATIFNAN